MKYNFNVLFLFLTGEVLLWAAGAGLAIGQEIRYTGSVQYASGSYYFTERTGSFYFNNGFGFSGDVISVYLTIPFIAQNTPFISYTSTGMGPLPTGGPKNGLVNNHDGQGRGSQMGKKRIDVGPTDTLNYTEANFGDPSLSGGFKIYSSEFGRTTINGNVGIKFPIADPNSGFGTGGWDFGAGISWSQRVRDSFLFMLNGMYWQLGDMDDLDFNNILSYSGAVGRSFRDGKLLTTANFLGSTQIIDDIDSPINIGAGIGLQASSKVNLNTSLLFGLTESASDLSITAGWSVQL